MLLLLVAVREVGDHQVLVLTVAVVAQVVFKQEQYL
jgi:hypothetical protein